MMGQEFKKSSVEVAIKVGKLFDKQNDEVGCLLVDRIDEATHYDTTAESDKYWFDQNLDYLNKYNIGEISFVEVKKEITYKEGVKIDDYKWGKEE